jgi:hypothetical protein
MMMPLAGLAAGLELSAMAGYSTTDGDDQARSNNPMFGASFRWPAGGRHSLKADYARVAFEGRIYVRHFVTGSYVLAGRTGRVRPFFQAGAGALFERSDFDRIGIPPPFDKHTGTDLVLILGAGATVALGDALFVRPMLRSYWYVGPTLTWAPAIGLGYRF